MRWSDSEPDHYTFIRPDGSSESKGLAWLRSNGFHAIGAASMKNRRQSATPASFVDSDEDMGDTYSGPWYEDYRRVADLEHTSNRFASQDIRAICEFWDGNAEVFIFKWNNIPGGGARPLPRGRMIADGGLYIQKLVHEESARRRERAFVVVLMWRSRQAKGFRSLHRLHMQHILRFVQAPLHTGILVERSIDTRPYPFVRLRKPRNDAPTEDWFDWKSVLEVQTHSLNSAARQADYAKVRELLLEGANPKLRSDIFAICHIDRANGTDCIIDMEESALANIRRIDELLNGTACYVAPGADASNEAQTLLSKKQAFRLTSLLLSASTSFWHPLGRDRSLLHPNDFGSLVSAIEALPREPDVLSPDEVEVLAQAIARAQEDTRKRMPKGLATYPKGAPPARTRRASLSGTDACGDVVKVERLSDGSDDCETNSYGSMIDDFGISDHEIQQLAIKRARDMLSSGEILEAVLAREGHKSLQGRHLLGLHNGHEYIFQKMAPYPAGTFSGICDRSRKKAIVLQCFQDMGHSVSAHSQVAKVSRFDDDDQLYVLPVELAVVIPEDASPAGSEVDMFDSCEGWFDEVEAECTDEEKQCDSGAFEQPADLTLDSDSMLPEGQMICSSDATVYHTQSCVAIAGHLICGAPVTLARPVVGYSDRARDLIVKEPSVKIPRKRVRLRGKQALPLWCKTARSGGESAELLHISSPMVGVVPAPSLKPSVQLAPGDAVCVTSCIPSANKNAEVGRSGEPFLEIGTCGIVVALDGDGDARINFHDDGWHWVRRWYFRHIIETSEARIGRERQASLDSARKSFNGVHYVYGDTKLISAARNGQADVVRELLIQGANPTLRSAVGDGVSNAAEVVLEAQAKIQNSIARISKGEAGEFEVSQADAATLLRKQARLAECSSLLSVAGPFWAVAERATWCANTPRRFVDRLSDPAELYMALSRVSHVEPESHEIVTLDSKIQDTRKAAFMRKQQERENRRLPRLSRQAPRPMTANAAGGATKCGCGRSFISNAAMQDHQTHSTKCPYSRRYPS